MTFILQDRIACNFDKDILTMNGYCIIEFMTTINLWYINL